jgi:hypothetical protein
MLDDPNLGRLGKLAGSVAEAFLNHERVGVDDENDVTKAHGTAVARPRASLAVGLRVRPLDHLLERAVLEALLFRRVVLARREEHGEVLLHLERERGVMVHVRRFVESARALEATFEVAMPRTRDPRDAVVRAVLDVLRTVLLADDLEAVAVHGIAEVPS